MFDQNTIEIYSDRDKIRQQMIDYMKDYLELDDIDLSKTSYLSYLINVVSMLTANLMYYNTSVSKEFFLTKCVQKESVLNLSSMLGYSPPDATPATVQILIGMPTTFNSTTEIDIPKDFKYYAGDTVFSQSNRVKIELINPQTPAAMTQRVVQYEEVGDEDDTIIKSIPFQYNDDKSIIYFSIQARQEELQTFEYQIPRLEPFEFHNIDVEFTGSLSEIEIVELLSSVGEEGDEWTRYNSLFEIPSATKGYVYRQTASGGRIYFGNGVIGRQPGSGQMCRVKIYTTRGSGGNVIAGSITRSDNVYVDVDVNGTVSTRPVRMDVINTAPATGGASAQTIDEIRASALARVSSSNRLVTSEDYRNIKYIVEDLPINNAIDVLKRSDIKRNEIVLFTDLIYENTVVPTRNISLTYDSTGLQIIPSGYELTVDAGTDYEDTYLTMFDMVINPTAQECTYLYVLSDLDLPVTLRSTETPDTKVLPTYVNMYTTRDLDDPDNDTLTITLYYQIIDPDAAYDFSHLEADFIKGWNLTESSMTHYYDSSTTVDNNFKITLPLSEVPYGEQQFTFRVKYDDPLASEDTIYFTAYSNTIVRRNLSEYMYSQVKSVLDPPNYENVVYDVPVILKSYYNDPDFDQDDFNLTIMQKIISFDVINYRMLTDFLNLKFSNTTGKLQNMYYNKRKYTVMGTDPAGVPSSPSNGDRYLITDDNCYFTTTRTAPFIAEWVASSSAWTYYGLAVNDMVYDSATSTMYIYNGEDMIDPTLDIPFNIRLIVWQEEGSSLSTQALTTRIRNNLVDKLYTKFGYDNAIYRSEIIKIVQSTTGVEHCQLVSPRHDIFFDYDIYEDFTQQQLLEYSPELVYFDTSTITIEVK